MKPGRARKDRPKGNKSIARAAGKRVERSAVARSEKRDNRRGDHRGAGEEKRSTFKRDDRKSFGKPFRKKEFKGSEFRGEKRFDRKTSAQDAVAGKNSVVEALRAKIPAKELVVALKTEIDEKISEAIRLAKNQDLPIKELPRRALDDLTGTSNHQGVALVIKPFNYSEVSKVITNAKKPMMLIGLDGITDPHNLGAVVRSAAAFGADGVIIPERRNAAMTGSAWKASAGAAARMPISQVTNLVRTIQDVKKAGCFVLA